MRWFHVLDPSVKTLHPAMAHPEMDDLSSESTVEVLPMLVKPQMSMILLATLPVMMNTRLHHLVMMNTRLHRPTQI